MFLKVLMLLSICSFGFGSGIASAPIIGAPAVLGLPAPVVAAASSQYFERTFNRLVAAPPILEPVVPVAPAPSVVSIPATPPVFVEPVTKTVNVNQVPDFSFAFATASAHAAAPVATILLPPYPFGFPPTLGFIPNGTPVPDEDRKEATTQSTTKTQPATTREPEPTTPLPQASNNANAFAVAQGLPGNENVKFRQYYAPPLPAQRPKPQKLKTSVEVVPVPLQYIAPPPLVLHKHVKPAKYFHRYGPAKIILRPVPVKIRTVRVPVKLVIRGPISRRVSSNPQNLVGLRPNTRDTEPTTFKPFSQPTTKPPRL